MPRTRPPLKIGLSPRFLHKSPLELGFRGKTLKYLEQSIAHWVMTQDALTHYDSDKYDENFHALRAEPGSELARLFVSDEVHLVTSIHHQSVRELGQGLAVEARSDPDAMVEAIRWQGDSYVFGMQWHPELHSGREGLVDCTPVLEDFLREARRRMAASSGS